MKHLAVVLLIALVGVPAHAQKTIVDGNSLDDQCNYSRQMDNGAKLTDAGLEKMGFCIGYVRGVLDEIWTQENLPNVIGVKNTGHSKICVSNSISNTQAIKVVIKYLQDNPAQLHLSANILIRLSLQEAFPCKSP